MRSLPLLIAALAAPSSAQTVLFSEDFESGLSAWTVGHDMVWCPWGHGASACGGSWMLTPDTAPCASWALPFPNGLNVVRFGTSPTQCNYDLPDLGVPDGSLTLNAPIALPAVTDGSIALRFWSKSEGEDDAFYDKRFVRLSTDGTTWQTIHQVWNSDWALASVDLTPWAGQSVYLKFRFQGEDFSGNDYKGWFVDGIVVEQTTETGVTFCAGDGSAADCPCGNFGASGRGCATSANPSGAKLVGGGVARMSADTATLTVSGVPQAVLTFFLGFSQQSFGLGQVFGDGLRCAGGNNVRMRSVFAAGNMAQIPGPSDPPLSQFGSLPVQGGFRTYQAWFRNAPVFCTSATFNTSNGIAIHWRP